MTNAATLTRAVPKPSHVPDSAVYDFDLFSDPGLLADPHQRILDLIKTAPPVFWTPRNGGHWILLSHSANFNASRDSEVFSNEFVSQAQVKAMMASLPPGTPHIPQAVPIGMDPPEHGKYRAPLQRAFAPKAVMALQESIRTLANELIDKVKPRGRCEFMSEIAESLPVQVFLKMLGLPLERQVEYRALVREYMEQINLNDSRKMIDRLQRVAAAMRDVVLERRDNPQDDLLSLLWKIEIDDKPTTLEDIENYGVLLFIAGLDTVMNGMGHGVRHLAQDLALQDDLRKNPKLVTDATEELLRRYTFTVPPRILGKDAVFEGLEMKKGERAMLFLPAADLDPKEFPNSDQFNLKRENNVHIAFNAGPHRCLGSHLARVELNILYEQMLERLPQFRIDPDHTPTFHGGHVIGVDTLRLVWDV
jgi:cytochrome P450